MKNNNLKIIFLFLLVGIFSLFALVSCTETSTPAVPSTAPAVPSTEIAAAESGMGTVSGRVMSSTTGQPIQNIFVRLARVIREDGDATYVLEDSSSPGAMTNSEGYYAIENVDAMEYVIVVGDVHVAYEIILEDSGKAKAWMVVENQILSTGDLIVEIP